MKRENECDIYLRDFLSSCVIADGKELDNYFLTYRKNNEDLKTLYNELDFSGSNVLSVLSSGDQFLTSYLLGADNVDTFDMNRLAMYYYYLRKWSIKYQGILYPVVENKKQMRSLLSLVVPETLDEKKALEFYKKHLDRGTRLENLFYDEYKQPKGVEIYSTAEEIQPIIDKDIKFKQKNMFIGSTSKNVYDYIIMSNILDWARNDKNKLLAAKYNLTANTTKGSKVICSRLVDIPRDKVLEEYSLFDDKFDVVEYPKSKNYVYIRK